MIRFLAGAILGALAGFALATLRADVEAVSGEEVERRTRPLTGYANVVPLTGREYVALRTFGAGASQTFGWLEGSPDDDLLAPENAGA